MPRNSYLFNILGYLERERDVTQCNTQFFSLGILIHWKEADLWALLIPYGFRGFALS
jgi:hypothetical protein